MGSTKKALKGVPAGNPKNLNLKKYADYPIGNFDPKLRNFQSANQIFFHLKTPRHKNPKRDKGKYQKSEQVFF